MKYNIHVYRELRIVVKDFEADNALRAVQDVEESNAFMALRNDIDTALSAKDIPAEICVPDQDTYYMVDPLKEDGDIDECHPDYGWRGSAPLYDSGVTDIRTLLWDILEKDDKCAQLQGIDPRLDAEIIVFKLTQDRPLDAKEYRRLPTLLNKDPWLDERIKEQLSKGAPR